MLPPITPLLRLRFALGWCALAVALSSAVPLVAQPRCWSTWLFGEGAGIRFVNDAGQFLDSAEVWPQAPQESIVEGVGIFCDSVNGRLLHWTSPRGVQSARGYGGILPAINSGVGTSSTQAGIMVPWHTPFFGDNLVYAHLVPDRTSNVNRRDPIIDVDRAAVVDQSTSPPTMPSVHVYTGTFTTERVCAARKPDSSGYLIYTIADDGLLIVRNETVLPSGVPSESRWPLGRSFATYGQMKVSRSGRMLAIADGQNVVLVDVDPMTGRPSAPRSVPLLMMPALRFGQPDMYSYGCAWATNERFLYLTVRYAVVNEASYAALIQIDVRGGFANAIANSSVLLDTIRITESTPPALQLGPDARIYMPNGRYLSVIRTPNRAGLRCSYAANHIDLAPRRSRSGLPSCVESDFPAPDEPYGILRRIYACSADSVVIEVDSLRGRILNYTVQPINPAGAAVANSRRIVLRGVAAGPIVVRLSLVGIDTTVQREFTINVDAVPPLAVGPDTVWLCRGQPAGIKARGATSYSFSSSAVFQRVGADSVVLPSVTAPTDVVVLGTMGDCTARRTVALRIIPTTASISADTSICAGSQATIVVQGASAVQWLDAVDGNPGATVKRLAPVATTTYRVAVQSGGCPDTLSTTVVVNPLPVITIADAVAACPGDSVTLWALGGHTMTWSAGGVYIGQGDTVRVLPSTSTTYDVLAESVFGCRSTATLRVELRDRYDVRVDVADAMAIPGVESTLPIDIEPEGLGHTYGIVVPRLGVDVAGVDNAQLLGIQRGTVIDTVVLRLLAVPPTGRVTVGLRMTVWFGAPQPLRVGAVLIGADGCANRVGRNGVLTYDVCAANLRNVQWLRNVTIRELHDAVEIEYDQRMPVAVRLYDVVGREYHAATMHSQGKAVVPIPPTGPWFMVVVVGEQASVVPLMRP